MSLDFFTIFSRLFSYLIETNYCYYKRGKSKDIMLSFTAQTKIPQDAVELVAFLDTYAKEFGVVERIVFSAINRGENLSTFEKLLQVQRRLSSQDVRNALTRAEALHKSQKELIGDYIKDCKNAISSIKDSIKKYEKKIKLLRKQGKKDPGKLKGIPSLERAIHQKRRKLARKEARVTALGAYSRVWVFFCMLWLQKTV